MPPSLFLKMILPFSILLPDSAGFDLPSGLTTEALRREVQHSAYWMSGFSLFSVDSPRRSWSEAETLLV